MMSREYRPRAGSRIGGEVAVDPHMRDVYRSQIDDVDIEDHRQVYVGVHIPLRLRKHHHQRHHHHRRKHRPSTTDGSLASIDGKDNNTSSLPTDKVRFILGGEENDECHKMFTELAAFQCDKDGNEEWREMARWLKFEEAVEEGGDRWSKPHVGTLSLYSLFELRSSLLRGTVLLDMNASNLTQIADLVLDDMVNKNHLEQDCRQRARDILLKRHRHQGTKEKKKSKAGMSSFGSFAKKPSSAGLSEFFKRSDSTPKTSALSPQTLEVVNETDRRDGEFSHLPSAVDLVGKQKDSDAKVEIERSNSETNLGFDANFMKKIPPGAEASNVLVGELDFLKKPVTAFVRLENACVLGDLTEVPVPTRFIFVMLGPPGTPGRYHEVGRAIATLMSDEIFHEVAYKAICREDLLAGIDEFLMQVTVLPPGEWDPSIRIEPPDAVPSQDNRLASAKSGGNGNEEDPEHDPAGDREEQLKKTGRLCGGVINDIKRRAPWYWSDFKDALNPQCIASIIFIYFACLTPIITFGGLMGTKTGKNMAAMEQILAGGIGGVLFSLFGGQPLIILGATGPMLVFEEILYTFCESSGIDYLPFRLWIGIWTMLYCFILVVTDASAFVRYFTRFTEESFATLIALIFIVEGFKKLFHVLHDSPVKQGYIDWHRCHCLPKEAPHNVTRNSNITEVHLNYPIGDCERYGGELVGDACHDNVFFLSVILAVGTFALAISLKGFRTSSYFPTKVRAVISDFAILISIVIMVGVDLAFGINTPKLDIPLKFQPTAAEKRGWIVPPLGKNPVWTIPAAAIPALLATILVFMDQQITALIVNRREHKLKKGAGYHLDLLLVAIIIGICSLLGLPWVVAATVLSVGHVQSLFVESQCTAPGEKVQFLGVREQRVTGTFIFILIGLTVFLAPLLKYVPMPVLFGLFFYMGFSALKGLQFYERLKIIFMPVKHQPDLMYLRQVPAKRVHIFTLIQLFCLAVLWAIKSTAAALIFPVMVLMLVAVRKVMEKVFTLHELEVLDDLMPENIKKRKAEEEAAIKKKDDDYEYDDDDDFDCPDGKKDVNDGKELNGTAPHETPINITEEMCKTSLWKTFVKDGTGKKPEKGRKKSSDKHKHKHRHHRHRDKHNRHKRDHEGKEGEEEGLWMLGKKHHDDDDDDEGSDAELKRKLSTINEDKTDVVIDMDQIQKSLLELNEIDNESSADEENEPAPAPAPAEGEAEAVV